MVLVESEPSWSVHVTDGQWEAVDLSRSRGGKGEEIERPSKEARREREKRRKKREEKEERKTRSGKGPTGVHGGAVVDGEEKDKQEGRERER